MIPVLILGTAQFSSGYGVTNYGDSMQPETMRSIVEFALQNDFRGFDTSPSYGNSYQILSEYGLSKHSITSKFNFPNTDNLKQTIQEIEKQICLSDKLSIENLLTHDPIFLQKFLPKYINSTFNELKKNNFTEKIGVTIYDVKQLEFLINNDIDCDVIQLPSSLLDQRFASSNLLKEFKNRGGRVQVRSIFLQGLTIADELPKKFNKYISYFRNINKFCEINNISKIDLTFIYLMKTMMYDEILIGAFSVNQLSEIKKSYNRVVESCLHHDFEFEKFMCEDLDLIDLSRWKYLDG